MGSIGGASGHQHSDHGDHDHGDHDHGDHDHGDHGHEAGQPQGLSKSKTEGGAEEDSTNVAIAASVGGAVALLLVAAVAYTCWRRHRLSGPESGKEMKPAEGSARDEV